MVSGRVPCPVVWPAEWLTILLSTMADDPNASAAVRNLVLDHASSAIFERNYLSRHIRYDTQAAFWGKHPRTELIRAADRMSRRMDPRRPTQLTDEQKHRVFREPDIDTLYRRRDTLRVKLERAKQTRDTVAVKDARRQLEDAKADAKCAMQARRRTLLDEVRAEHDKSAALQEIERQLGGHAPLKASINDERTAEAPSHVFVERVRVALAVRRTCTEGVACLGVDGRFEIMRDMIRLCDLQETRRARRPRCSPLMEVESSSAVGAFTPPVEPTGLTEKPPVDLSELPLKCNPKQCLFCLGDQSMPYEARTHKYTTPSNMRKHTRRCRPGLGLRLGPIPCPHPNNRCRAEVLRNGRHFKNHAKRVHRISLGSC